MALKVNGGRLLTNACRTFGGNAVAGIYGLGVTALASTFTRGSGVRLNFFDGPHTVSGVTDRSSIPSGARPPVAVLMPRATGGLAGKSAGVATVTATGIIGRNIAATAAGTSTVTGTAALVVSGSGTAAGSATTSGNLQAALAASGTASGAATATGTLLARGRGIAVAAGVGSATATLTAKGQLIGSIAPAVELEASSFSAYLLDSEDIETGMTLRQALRLVAAASAGKISGAGGSTVTIRNAFADSKDRITATVDNDGNRTAITYDLVD